MAATLYTSKYLCLNILSTDVKDGQIHLSIMKILIGLLNTEMIGNYRKDSRSLFQMDQNCFLNQSHTRGSLFCSEKVFEGVHSHVMDFPRTSDFGPLNFSSILDKFSIFRISDFG